MSARDLSESQTTFPSDSENYDANHSNSNDSSDEPRSDSSSPMILYQPPTLWSLLRGAAINLFLPFVNGLMLGFGELFAHEAAFRLGWSNTKVRSPSVSDDRLANRPRERRDGSNRLTHRQVFPTHRSDHKIGPGIEMREDPIERRRRDGEEMDAYTSLE